MNYTRKSISFIFILFIVFILFFIIKNTKRDKRCNKIVILKDGEGITCMWVNTYKKADNQPDYQIYEDNYKPKDDIEF